MWQFSIAKLCSRSLITDLDSRQTWSTSPQWTIRWFCWFLVTNFNVLKVFTILSDHLRPAIEASCYRLPGVVLISAYDGKFFWQDISVLCRSKLYVAMGVPFRKWRMPCRVSRVESINEWWVSSIKSLALRCTDMSEGKTMYAADVMCDPREEQFHGFSHQKVVKKHGIFLGESGPRRDFIRSR